MLKPTDYGPYMDLRKRVLQSMHIARVDDQIFETVHGMFEKTMNMERLVLSRPERDRLLKEVMKSLLTDMLAKLEGAK